MHAGECPESTVGIELGSRLARSIVWVICRISGKMKALSTVLRAPAVVSLITADTESERERESKCFKCYQKSHVKLPHHYQLICHRTAFGSGLITTS